MYCLAFCFLSFCSYASTSTAEINYEPTPVIANIEVVETVDNVEAEEDRIIIVIVTEDVVIIIVID